MVLYIPNMAKEIWTAHRCGIGIYIIQGFERRNKESKNTMRRFNNNKSQKLEQNLKRLWDLLYNGKKRLH